MDDIQGSEEVTILFALIRFGLTISNLWLVNKVAMFIEAVESFINRLAIHLYNSLFISRYFVLF